MNENEFNFQHKIKQKEVRICDAIHLNVDSIHETTIAKFDANIIRFDPIMCQNLCIINGLMAAPNATVDNKRIFSSSEN